MATGSLDDVDVTLGIWLDSCREQLGVDVHCSQHIAKIVGNASRQSTQRLEVTHPIEFVAHRALAFALSMLLCDVGENADASVLKAQPGAAECGNPQVHASATAVGRYRPELDVVVHRAAGSR